MDLCPHQTTPAWSLLPQGTREGYHWPWVPQVGPTPLYPHTILTWHRQCPLTDPCS